MRLVIEASSGGCCYNTGVCRVEQVRLGHLPDMVGQQTLHDIACVSERRLDIRTQAPLVVLVQLHAKSTLCVCALCGQLRILEHQVLLGG